MRSLVLATTCSLAALAGGVTPAAAKGPMVVAVSAPGMEDLVVRPDGGDASDPFYELQEQVGYWTAMSPGLGTDGSLATDLTATDPQTGRPPGDLGPVVRLTWDDPHARATTAGSEAPTVGGGPALVQDLHPWADAGPVAFLPAGQQTFDEATTASWTRVPGDLAATLTALGVPDRPALEAAARREGDRQTGAGAEAAAPPDPAARRAGDDDLPWTLAGLGAVAAAGAVGGLVVRRRAGRAGRRALGDVPTTGAAA